MYTNEQVEAVNKFVLNRLKKWFDALEGKWAVELKNILWPIRATPKNSAGESPFCLVYVSEAVAPVEIAMSIHVIRHFN